LVAGEPFGGKEKRVSGSEKEFTRQWFLWDSFWE